MPKSIDFLRGSKTHPNESTNKAGDGSIEGTMKKFKLEKFTAGETFGADEALMKKVLKKLKQKDEKKQKHRIIVFCPITSRVGSDVVAALDTVKGKEDGHHFYAVFVI
ncbi:hypothetical protein ATANTOWER_000471 [Ataeniobius toweri]|uniref:Uncharacterized protein n=1 Tax=Ataeniobius toweri TaxID=208326 RepID=A0ABU7BCW0_9TELE|nr:hypothetical protein [Ataeniobius toweri]